MPAIWTRIVSSAARRLNLSYAATSRQRWFPLISGGGAENRRRQPGWPAFQAMAGGPGNISWPTTVCPKRTITPQPPTQSPWQRQGRGGGVVD